MTALRVWRFSRSYTQHHSYLDFRKEKPTCRPPWSWGEAGLILIPPFSFRVSLWGEEGRGRDAAETLVSARADGG